MTIAELLAHFDVTEADFADALARELRAAPAAAASALTEPRGVDPRRARAPYGFKLGASLRLPLWQFNNDEPIPGLRAVLAALPADLHPLEVAGVMTTPDPAPIVAGEAGHPARLAHPRRRRRHRLRIRGSTRHVVTLRLP